MSRNDNLRPLNERDPKEARAIRAAGGRAAAKAKARNNKLRARLEYMLNQSSGKTTAVIRPSMLTDDVVNTDGTYYDDMCASLVRKSCSGDMRAISMVLDILGDTNYSKDNEEY